MSQPQQVLDTNSLNALLFQKQQGEVLKIDNAVVNTVMAGSLFMPIQIPSNVDLEFHNVTFSGDQVFRQAYKGRLLFKDCRFRGRRLEFSKSKEGDVSFYGQNHIASGISFEECDQTSLSIDGDNCTFEIHPEWRIPSGAQMPNLPRTINISVHQSSGGIFIKNLATPVIIQIWNSNLTTLMIDANEIKLFQLIKSKIESLDIKWKKLGRWNTGGNEFGFINLDFLQFIGLPLLGDLPLSDGIDSRSLESVAKTYKNLGEIPKFIRTFSKAGNGEIRTQILTLKKNLQSEMAEKGSFWNKAYLNARFGTKWISLGTRDILVNCWFQRFYAIIPILISQCLVVGIFGLIYSLCNGSLVSTLEGSQGVHSFCDSLYFSATTFLTTDYGDIIPSGIFRWVAVLEGYIGLSFSLLLAVVVSRRYSS